MNEKFVAGLVTALVIAPICAICVLGPAVAIALVAGVAGWLGGAGPILTLGFLAAAGALGWRTLRRRRAGRLVDCGDAPSDPVSPTNAAQRIRRL